MLKQRTLILGLVIFIMVMVPTAVRADETALFTNVAPDAVFMLDLSGSMSWNPAGDTKAYGNTACSTSTPFALSSSVTTPMDCKRLSIAKRAMFTILDDNVDGKLNCYDGPSLNIRMGYMPFRNTETVQSNYNKVTKDIGKPYQDIYCSASTACGTSSMYYCQIGGGGTPPNLSMESAGGSTPLNFALNEIKTYLNTNKAADASRNCRQKFVILISDGADTLSCGGIGTETAVDMYKRRRLSVTRVKALADAGYKVFVIGFGANMPDYLKNTLNWMAYYGGTDNPLDANIGDTDAFDPTLNAECAAVAVENTSGDLTGSCLGTSTDCYAKVNDPGNTPLSGYAFLTSNSTELVAALKQAMEFIRESTYSFSTASVASARTQDEDYIYEASFQPVNNDPTWLGHVRKYPIDSNGDVGSVSWDAGNLLQSATAASRTIKTLKAGVLTSFDTTSIVFGDLGVTTDTERNDIVGYVRGETASNKDNWKLGDIFRSTPVTIGTPSTYFKDNRDANSAFDTFRSSNVRSTANGLRTIVAGANDGQLHSFRTSTGAETWSFIPPNLRSKLKNIAHKTHPTGLTHQYFVDGPISVADVWLGSGNGKAKAASDWKTLLVFAEGRGSTSYLWSSSATCDSGFSNNYDATYKYYCGYWALDVTNTTSPAYKWRINMTDAQAPSIGPYLGDPWSKIYIHRVKINGEERWVGFMGGGHNLSNLTLCVANGDGYGDCDKRGKGLFVIDMKDGSILWYYTHGSGGSQSSYMEYSMAGSPAVLDLDLDGLIDTVYMGDLGGNMWRLRLCTAADSDSCNTSNWTLSRLFQAGGTEYGKPIYTIPAAAKDPNGNLWVYWGTGDRVNLTSGTTTDYLFAVKESGNFTGTRTPADLQNVSSSGQVYNDTTKQGWYIQMPGAGEKVLSDSTVFGGILYFTSYLPPTGSDPCSLSGTSNLYGLNYITGGGALDSSGSKVRSTFIGNGMVMSPSISFDPSGRTDMFLTSSNGTGPWNPHINFGNTGKGTNLLFWNDKRIIP